MKITTNIPLSRCKFEITWFDRTTLADDIQRYWVGSRKSVMGLQYLKYEKGVVLSSGFYERTDIGRVIVSDPKRKFLFNVFFEADGSYCAQAGEGMELTTIERKSFRLRVHAALRENSGFVGRHLRWFKEKPWEQVYNMTPKEAVQKFTELGWGPKEKGNG